MSATRLQVEGAAPGTAGSRTLLNSVGPRYFATLGIPFVRGRDFAATDRDGAPTVAIINEALARSYFPGQNALGKRVRESVREPYFEIIGVVRDSKFGSMGEAPTPVFYSAYMQRPRISTQIRPVIIHVRTAGAPAAIVPELRRAIADVDSTVFADVRTLRDATGGEAQLRQFGTQMIGTIGAVALLLAIIGLYGMMAFVVIPDARDRHPHGARRRRRTHSLERAGAGPSPGGDRRRRRGRALVDAGADGARRTSRIESRRPNRVRERDSGVDAHRHRGDIFSCPPRGGTKPGRRFESGVTRLDTCCRITSSAYGCY